ncbi:MAG TPA: ATP-dependent RNA helicase HrpA [Micromonosporaceae bacterium]|jgi:ATP-dependent helicase HrpA
MHATDADSAPRPSGSDDRPTAAALRERVARLTLVDEQRLARALHRATPGHGRAAPDLADLAGRVVEAEARLAARASSVPIVRYPEELPVSQRREDIAAAIRDHRVVVVAGETGSGKTTQLPKICLDLGRGVRGMIGHTQPRRIAARSVAERIATELATPLGEAVGFQVRFTGKVGDRTLVKLMTDGILLAETQHDRSLLSYDTIIIDEAHERSLNIDFLLGYLTQLLPRREDLKLIITSATIDPQRFADHFSRATNSPVPVLEVSGRTYPVELRYRPLSTVDEPAQDEGQAEEEVRDQVTAICDAVDELAAQGPGDILVFLSGEREIRDTADALRRRNLALVQAGALEVLPLFARLSTADQLRVFSPHTGRRVVLATNVAETSLTVPGIRYVVDPGTARISRYSQRLKVQRLPIEPVSQASANQRAGRCGRTSDGICIRLYSEEDYQARPQFTDPEILRTNLASVILQMAALDLGDVATFPFVEPPDRRSVRDGVVLLRELGAFAPEGGSDPDRPRGQRVQVPRRDQSVSPSLTTLGARLAQLPLDPRLGRMVLEAQRNGCLREVLVIAAALSIQDPRERPLEHQQAADAQHARFRDADSDFLTLLNLWRYLVTQQKQLSSSQFRRLCRTDFLNYLRVREWQDLENQLRQIVRGMGADRAPRTSGEPTPRTSTSPAAPRRIPSGPIEEVDRALVHQALLAGLLSHIGLRDGTKAPRTGGSGAPRGRTGVEYIGARGARFAIFPGSALAKRNPTWVMAAELVETSRLWARVVARIEPEWAERLAPHLVRREYSEPRWDADRGSVVATERVSLYGLPLVMGRSVQYGRIDPVVSRELFLRHALVEGDWQTRHHFFHANRALLAEVADLEHRARRHDIVADDETLFAFYDARVPAPVVSGRHFDAWWKRTRRTDPELLTLTRAQLMAADAPSPTDYPDQWRQGSLRLALSYHFAQRDQRTDGQAEPDGAADGVTVHIGLVQLGQVTPEGFDWQVPGLRRELITALLRSLPKQIRRQVVPVPDYAAALYAALPTEPAGLLVDELRATLRALVGLVVNRDDFTADRVPDHLRMTFRIEDASGAIVAEGKDLEALRRELAPKTRTAVQEATDDIARSGLREWHPGTLARVVQRRRAGQEVTAYPALVDEVDSVGVRAFASAAEQARAMAAGTRRLLLLEVPTPVPVLSKRLTNAVKLGLTRYPYARVPDLLEDCVAAAMDAIIARHGGPAFDDAGHARLRAAANAELPDLTASVVVAVEKVVAAAHAVRFALAAPQPAALEPSIEDMREHLVALIRPGFVTTTGVARLADLPRYLRGIGMRLSRLPGNPSRDRAWMQDVHDVRAEYDDLLATMPAYRREAPDVVEVRWMIEELRISLFAQELRTPYPVSPVRIYRFIDALR